MKIFSGYVREQKRYTKNELKSIFSFDEAGVEKFIRSLKAYGVLKSVKNSTIYMIAHNGIFFFLLFNFIPHSPNIMNDTARICKLGPYI